MARSVARGIVIVLGCLLLAIAVVVGVRNGWIDLRGRPIQKIRELEPRVDERNRQIEDLANPGRDGGSVTGRVKPAT